MNPNEIDIREGSVVFTIHANKVSYDNNQPVPLAQLSPQQGSILIVKDSDNKMKFFHVYLGKGRTDVEYDVSKLDKTENHQFGFTWSVQNKEIVMYIDGKRVASSKINY